MLLANQISLFQDNFFLKIKILLRMSSKIKFRIFDSMSKLKSLFKIKNENRERQQELVLRGGFHSRRALSVGNQITITRIYYMKYMVEERKLHFFDAEELASITCREEDCRRRHHEDGRIIVEEIKARFNDSTSTSFSSTRGEWSLWPEFRCYLVSKLYSHHLHALFLWPDCSLRLMIEEGLSLL